MLLQEADFYMYSLYSKNKPKSDDIMTECGSQYFAVSVCIIEFLKNSVGFMDVLPVCHLDVSLPSYIIHHLDDLPPGCFTPLDGRYDSEFHTD